MKLKNTLLATGAALAVKAFENDAGWKIEDGKVVTDSDGNPVLIAADGGESSVRVDTIAGLQSEARGHRLAKEKAEKALKAFEGLDPKKAREAIDAMKDVNLDDLVSKDRIDEVKRQVAEQYAEDMKERDQAIAATKQENDSLRLDHAFSSSEFLNQRLTVPVDAARATFRSRFKVDDGKVVPLNDHGEPLMSRKNIGETAGVDEAFAMFIEERPDKEAWLKAPDADGSGSQGSGGGRGQGNTMKRNEFDSLDPGRKAAVGQKVGAGEMKIID